ncbi:MAG: AAA family ATPase [Clostridia bacterium]|nr:AAA family ATPase [Clostridia bacterium]
MEKSVVEEILSQAEKLLETKDFIIIAIDGRCASGKTTLAYELRQKLNCNTIHMDDFFLRPEQRTKERYDEIGGNVDYERFEEEVLASLKANAEFEYRPFDCHTLDFKEPIKVVPNKITVIEGSYSCHDKFGKYYDINIFLDADKDTQLERIKKRNGTSALQMFKDKWIPLEERYFENKEITWRKYE